MLRAVLGAVGALYLAAAAVTYAVHLPLLLSGYLTVNGLLVVAGLIVERSRYRPAGGEGLWETTGERFVDPSSGHLIEVRYNARTGRRRYDDLGPANQPPPSANR